MKRILLVKTSSLGDVVHNLPVVNDIRQHYPDAEIDWVVEEGFAKIPHLHPQINHIIPVAIRRWRKQCWRMNTWHEINHCKHLLSTRAYDTIIDTQGLLKSGLITHYARGNKHGYDQASIREPIASRFYHHHYAISYQQHAVTRNRKLVAMSLGYPIPKTRPEYGIQAGNIDLDLPKPFIMGFHATSRESKRWAESQWIKFGQHLAQLKHYLILPWGNNIEFEQATHIANRLENGIVLPKLDIAQLAAVSAQAKAVVGVDTGLTHLAVALSIPTVAIYTDTDPTMTGVMAGNQASAINLGGIAQVPEAKTIVDTLQQIVRL